jgi:hypothetical protein
MMATSMGGQWLKTDGYVEYLDPVTGVTVAYCALEDGEEGMCYIEPYPVASELSAKRAVARRIGTTYAYDFLGLFEKGVISEWQAAIAAGNAEVMPPNLLEAEELLQDDDGSLYKGSRTVGENKVGGRGLETRSQLFLSCTLAPSCYVCRTAFKPAGPSSLSPNPVIPSTGRHGGLAREPQDATVPRRPPAGHRGQRLYRPVRLFWHRRGRLL